MSDDAWVLPASIAALGANQRVRYDGAGPWNGPLSCGGSFSAGARALKAYIMQHFPGVASIGGYDCRANTANAAELSVHGTGRALDIMIPPVDRKANSRVGDPVANWLVAHAASMGVQYVLWNNRQWSASHTPQFRPYTGPNSHRDHIHVELNLDGAAMRTPFYSGAINEPPFAEDGGGFDLGTLFGMLGVGAVAVALYRRKR